LTAFLEAVPPIVGNLIPIQELATVIAKHATTTDELRFVLGYTFHAHSCATKTAMTPTICIPLRHNRNGVAQTIYT
jgi:hypothetical protein